MLFSTGVIYSEDMPFADETFDFVFSLNSLDHVDDLDDTPIVGKFVNVSKNL